MSKDGPVIVVKLDFLNYSGPVVTAVTRGDFCCMESILPNGTRRDRECVYTSACVIIGYGVNRKMGFQKQKKKTHPVLFAIRGEKIATKSDDPLVGHPPCGTPPLVGHPFWPTLISDHPFKYHYFYVDFEPNSFKSSKKKSFSFLNEFIYRI